MTEYHVECKDCEFEYRTPFENGAWSEVGIHQRETSTDADYTGAHDVSYHEVES